VLISGIEELFCAKEMEKEKIEISIRISFFKSITNEQKKSPDYKPRD